MKSTQYGTLTVIRSAAAAAFIRDGKTVATARHVTGGWALRIPGYQWPVTPDMPTARFNQIPVDKITETPVKAFKTWQESAKEVERVLLTYTP